MQTDSLPDNDLLSAWVDHGCGESFHALVHRYASLVQMTALRSCASDTMAAEAAQLTFILLARKAKSLTARRSLAGWLHLTAVMQVKNLVRQARRETRKRQQFTTVMKSELNHPPQGANAWLEMRPVLDEALCALSDRDREALLMRFYRSLSVREMAEALGIATEAVQKRLERALARLRGQLSRRGCHQAGTPLTAALFTGFTAGPQAAFPAAASMAAKALSAGGGTAGPAACPAVILSIATSMKLPVLVLPILALLLALLWIGPKYVLISKLEREMPRTPGGVPDPLAAADSSNSDDRSASSVRPVSHPVPAGAALDWKKVVAHYEEGKDRKSMAENAQNLKEYWRFQERLASMSTEELAEALATLPPQKSGFFTIKGELLGKLMEKDPEFALKRFSGQLHHYGSQLADALKLWARKDADRAVVWFDQQVAAGLFETGRLDGESKIRARFDASLIGVLLPVDAGAAAIRLDKVEAGRREAVIRVLWMDQSLRPDTPKTQAAYAGLIREYLPPDTQAAAIARAVGYMPITAEFAEVTQYMNNIGATPAERSLCVAKAAEYRITGLIHERKISAEDLEAVRNWVGSQAPEALSVSTGKALGALAGKQNQMDFAEAAAQACRYDSAAGNQEVLSAFLASESALGNREQAQNLALSISDEARRKEILQKLQ